MYRLLYDCKNHQNKTILGVCVDYECKEEKIYCEICRNLHQHLENKLLPFEKLPDWFCNFFDKFEQTQEQLKKYQSLIETFFDQFEMTYIKLFIKEIIQIGNILESLQFYLKQSMQKLENKDLQQKQLQPNLGSQQANLILNLQNLQNQQNQQNVKINYENLHTPKQSFTQLNTTLYNIKFQNEQRNQHIKITNDGKEVSSLNSSNFILGQPMIPKNLITKFAIKLLNPYNYVAFGVGNQEMLRQNNYYVDLYNQSNHGTYLLNSHGIIFSHSQQKKPNTQFISFQVNDIIIVEVNMKESKITWSKMGEKSCVSISFNNSLDLYPLIQLNLSAVQVIDKF